MTEFEPEDLVELRVRGEFMDVVGLLSHISVEIVEGESDRAGYNRAQEVVSDLADQANSQINFGLAERQLKRRVQSDEVLGYRGIDVRIHEFDPRHPDVESEIDAERLPPLEDAEYYAIVTKHDDGMHMAGHPDQLDMDMAMEIASLLRIYAREMEGLVTQDMGDEP